MSWRERDYSQADPLESKSYHPAGLRVMFCSTAALVLAGLHTAAFAAVHLVERSLGWQAKALLGLHAEAHPIAIITHPLATNDALVFLLAVLAVWMLASRAVLRRGTWSILAIYASGNCLAGCTFWLVGRIEPAWAAVGLDFPLGGLAALLLDLWPRRSELPTSGVAGVVGTKTLIACGLVLAGGVLVWLREYGALAWCAAGLTGALTAPLSHILSDCLSRQRAAAPEQSWRASGPVDVQRLSGPSIANAEVEPEIDDILAKISREGFSRLSEEERQRLELARQMKLRRTSRS